MRVRARARGPRAAPRHRAPAGRGCASCWATASTRSSRRRGTAARATPARRWSSWASRVLSREHRAEPLGVSGCPSCRCTSTSRGSSPAELGRALRRRVARGRPGRRDVPPRRDGGRRHGPRERAAGLAGAARERRAAPHGGAQRLASAARTRGMSATLRARRGASLMTPSLIRRLISVLDIHSQDARGSLRIPRPLSSRAAAASPRRCRRRQRAPPAAGRARRGGSAARRATGRRGRSAAPGHRAPRSCRRAHGRTTRRPAELVDGLVVEAVDVEAAAPVRRCSGEPAATVTAWAGSKGSCVWRCSSLVRSGRCWCSVPPRATLSACIPRQIASSGRSRAVARAQQRELVLVARRGRRRARAAGGARARTWRGRGPGRR